MTKENETALLTEFLTPTYISSNLNRAIVVAEAVSVGTRYQMMKSLSPPLPPPQSSLSFKQGVIPSKEELQSCFLLTHSNQPSQVHLGS